VGINFRGSTQLLSKRRGREHGNLPSSEITAAKEGFVVEGARR
jgi:hypothetical protein